MFLFDLHCHTRERSYDGRVDAVTIVRTLAANGFHGVAFTDHNALWTQEQLDNLRAEAGIDPDFVLFSGQEVRTAAHGIIIGDLLVFGIDEELPDGTDPGEVFALLREHNGFALAAHPGIERLGLGNDLGNYPVIAAEVWNGRYGNANATRARELAERFAVPGFGGSDTHHERDIAGGGTLLPALPATLGELRQLLESGQARPWKPGVLDRIQDSSSKILKSFLKKPED